MEQDIINFLRDWFGPLPWVQILVSSGVLSMALLAVRKWRLYRAAKKEIDALFEKEWFTDLVVVLLAFGEAFGHYLLTAGFTNPKMVAFQGVLQVFTMNRFYIWVLKPLYISRKAKLQPKIDIVKKVAAELAREKASKIISKDMDDVLLAPYSDVMATPAYLNPTPEAAAVRPQDFTKTL